MGNGKVVVLPLGFLGWDISYSRSMDWLRTGFCMQQDGKVAWNLDNLVGASWDVPGCSGEITLLHHVSRRVHMSRKQSCCLQQNTCSSGEKLRVAGSVKSPGNIPHPKVVSFECDRASKVNLQPANKGALYRLHPGTKMHCVLLRASRATGKMGHILLNSGRRYFLAESSGPSYTGARDYTQNSFIYKATSPWNYSTAAIPSLSLCASFKMSLLILGWKMIGLEEWDCLIVKEHF